MLDIRNCDCMALMAEYPDKHFELAIVDPPYGIGDFCMYSSGGEVKGPCKKQQVTWNNSIPDEKYFNELRRVSKKQIIWGSNYYNCFSQLGGAVIWYKNVGHSNLSDCEIASVSWQKKVDYVYIQKLTGFVADEVRIHPCQKPTKLYRWLLENYAKPGDKILDTHLGSGSIAIACHYMGFDLTACELDKDYYEAAMKRIEQETAQLSLL